MKKSKQGRSSRRGEQPFVDRSTIRQNERRVAREAAINYNPEQLASSSLDRMGRDFRTPTYRTPKQRRRRN